MPNPSDSTCIGRDFQESPHSKLVDNSNRFTQDWVQMKRIARLDGVRALAFLTIFVHHGFNIPHLWAGVDIFFVLSGFLITSILMQGRGKEGAWSHFYERRALRILPPYLVFLLLATFFLHLHWGKNAIWYALFAMNIAEVFNLGVPGLGILWSLAVEEQFYLFWPIVALRFSPRIVLRFAIALIILAPILRGIATPFLHEHSAIYYLMPFRMDLLASGAVLSVLWLEPGALAAWRRWGLVLMGGGLLLLVVCVRVFHDFHAEGNTILFNVLGYSLICCVATGLLAFTLGAETGWWMRLMTWKPVRWIGLVSYTSYLIHAGVLALNKPSSSEVVNVALAFVFVIAYASLSWHLLEKPILQLRPSAWLSSRKKQTV
jgi:peptidoglycan/LPS O-acetylase OafA/YrhL